MCLDNLLLMSVVAQRVGSAAPRLDRVRLRWIIPAEAGIRLTSVIPVLPAAQCRGMMSARTGSLWPARARRQRGEGMRTEIHRLPGAITGCYLIKERGLILVDAGPPQKAEQLLKSLRPLSVDPRDISLVVLTHAHWDHICALTEWKRLSGCKVAVSHRDHRPSQIRDVELRLHGKDRRCEHPGEAIPPQEQA